MRQLSESCGLAAAAPAGQDFAERLGAWLSVADAITLRTALQTQPVARSTQATNLGQGFAPDALLEALQRVRATLTQSLTTVEAALPQRNRADHSAHGATAAPPVPLDPVAELAMLNQRYGEQQRRMEMSIDALRAHARQVLSQASPGLARLAALDAVMEQMLGEREQHALSTVPAFLKKRFEQLRREAAAEAETLLGETPNPSQQLTWLAQLATEFQQALLAELDLRLLPIAGMAEALQSSAH
ncbi:MAG: DUF3348 family protein [Hydrogenophaga sp.]